MSRVQRANVAGILLPDEVSETLLRGAAEASIVQSFARSRPMRAQNVTLTEAEVTGANVFWVGEGNRKQTDAPTMSQKTWTMSAAEVAVIIPLDENVADDSDVDLFELYKPSIETAIGAKIDNAALFGVDKPVAWGSLGTDIVPSATTANHAFLQDGTPTDAELLDLISGTMAAEGCLTAIENDGYDPNGSVAQIRFKGALRALKDADERYIFGDAVSDGIPATLFGIPIAFAKRDVWPAVGAPDASPDGVHLIMGDWEQAIVGTRAGIRYKIFDQGVITDGAGNVVYSLMENDQVALRVTARYGFKVIADDTADGETLASDDPFPFSVLRPAAS